MRNQLKELLNEIQPGDNTATFEILCTWAKELEDSANPGKDLLPGSYEAVPLFIGQFIRLMKLIHTVYGNDVIHKLVELINRPSCPYPWEMIGTASELAAGTSQEDILSMLVDGSLEDFHDYHRTPPEIEKRFTVSIQDSFEPGNLSWILTFRRNIDIVDPEIALRGAIREFLSLDNKITADALAFANGRFNWGDVLRSVPDDLFKKYGLTLIEKYETVNITVDFNETFNTPDNERKSEL